MFSCAAAEYHLAACVAPRQYRLWGFLAIRNHDAGAIGCLHQQSASKLVLTFILGHERMMESIEGASSLACW